MRYYNTILLAELLLALFMPGLFISESYGNKSDLANDCEASCAAMDGDSRIQCIRTCINTKRKNGPVGGSSVKKHMELCEDACGDQTGVDRIKCIRLCLDRNKAPAVTKRDALKKDDENPCRTRCSVLSGASRDKCLLRCGRESRFEKRD
jgi:hypothetical protein